ncbi:hypothetical protein ACIGO9_28760 [Nocardia asteroides]|uniref:hypothetical protein n=1 Tax=Nocardia asteroides TaxID=1824 RepID=UPI0037CC35B1
MPHDIITHPDHDRGRSLGWIAIAWLEYFAVHGPGDLGGDPVAPIIDEYCGFLIDTYALDGDGRRIYDHVFLSRPKGCAKSEIAAFIGLFEALGPCRFDGWARGGEVFTDEWGLGFRYVYAAGEPMGKRLKQPYIRCVATEEDQAGLIYDTIHLNLTEGPLRRALPRRDDAGLTRILVPGGGEIVPSTSSAASKDGGKDTLTLFDEALALDTPVPTYHGMSTMGALELGDIIFGSDGHPTRVVKVSEIMTDRDCYRVTFSDKTELVTSAGHIWLAKPYGGGKPREWTTGQMFEDGRRFSIPPSQPWQHPPAELDIDPYILGLWLGDGDARNATISSSIDDAPAVVENIENCGYTAKRLAPKHGTAELIYVSLPGSHRNRWSPVRGLKVRLAAANLIANKHVPEAYLTASVEQRTALLQGLMDSDGSITPNGYCNFTITSSIIADAMMRLLWSLGETPGRRFAPDARSRQGGVWVITFTPRNVVPFRLPRKVARIQQSGMTRWLSIRSIEPVDPVPVKCIAVEAEDHLFLAGASGRVTHNTHLYNKPELRQTYKTLTRNLRKRRRTAQTFAVETTTMYAPGEDSIAEQTYKLIQDVLQGKLKSHPRQLFDHRYGAITPEELDDEDKVRSALVDAYGDCTWNDIDGYVEAISDPRNDVTSSFRYWFNSPTSAENAWLAAYEWDGIGPGFYDGSSSLSAGDVVVLGFDGSRRRRRGVTDATALVACRVSDGLIVPLKVWEQPPGVYEDGWEVPEHDVDAKILDAFTTYTVVGFYADPARWEANVAAWEAKYGKHLQVKASQQHPIEWWMTGSRAYKTVEALREFVDGVLDRKIRHDGNLTLRAHVLNARRAETPKGIQIRKENPDSPNKIDGAVAAVLAWQARLDAVAKGIGARKRRRVAVRVR